MSESQLYFLKRGKSYPKKKEIVIKSGYVPISMNNSHFNNNHSVAQILEWVSKHTSTITFVVGDYLHRNNLILLNDFSETEAIVEALKMGDEHIKKMKLASRNYNLNVEFIRTESFYLNEKFDARMGDLLKCFDSDSYFKKLVNETIDIFLKRQKTPIIDMEKARFYCRKYLLEEIIIFEFLAKDGFVENIYPGKQLKIMKEIVRGNLSISEPLSKSILIELVFLKR